MTSNNLGYKVGFLCKVDEKYHCVVCKNVLYFPIRLKSCDHHACSGCVKEIFRPKYSNKCPVDGQSIKIEELEEDSSIHKEILHFNVCCQNNAAGCNWTGLLDCFNDHKQQCPFEIIECPKGCKLKIQRQSTDNHLATDCYKREVFCEYCRKPILYDQLKSHWTTCQMYLVQCPNSPECGKFIRKELSQHIENCKYLPTLCQFAEEGCSFAGNNEELKNHLRKDNLQHMIILRQQIENQERTIEEQNKLIQQQYTILQNLQQRSQHVFTYGFENYSKRFNLARKYLEHSLINSDPFTVGKYGYKFCILLFPNGNGPGKNKYLSVYIHLMCSNYDNVLSWPFTAKVLIELIDQDMDINNRQNITYSIIPDKNRKQAAFAKPKCNAFTYFGSSMLISHKQLKTRKYIVNDTLYVSVTITLTEDIGI